MMRKFKPVRIAGISAGLVMVVAGMLLFSASAFAETVRSNTPAKSRNSWCLRGHERACRCRSAASEEAETADSGVARGGLGAVVSGNLTRHARRGALRRGRRDAHRNAVLRRGPLRRRVQRRRLELPGGRGYGGGGGGASDVRTVSIGAEPSPGGELSLESRLLVAAGGGGGGGRDCVSVETAQLRRARRKRGRTWPRH